MQKREGGKNRECDGLAGHREVQHRKTSPERRTWTAHLPHGRESKPRGSRRWPWGDEAVSSVTPIFSRK